MLLLENHILYKLNWKTRTWIYCLVLEQFVQIFFYMKKCVFHSCRHCSI